MDTATENSNKEFVKKKIFNDPIYGLVNFPHKFLYQLIDHPYVQRLRRIKQLGLTDYVYSGGSHSRFNHCLGALHLMTQAIQNLQYKGVEISRKESEAASIAILLHDIGHGPFSHALEHHLLPYHHEQISIRIMELLNKEFGGRLELAIRIFRGQYEKPFLFQLVSSQIDMDRMDYLIRDSFYTGVVEGMIGYDRIIKMMNVRDGQLVIEEKGALSIEQFLMARRMMYWQVYLHKTVIAAEKMLQQLFRMIHQQGPERYRKSIGESLWFFFEQFDRLKDQENIPDEVLHKFLAIDDTEIIYLLKSFAKKEFGASQLLADGILDRHIFKISIKDEPFSRDFTDTIRHNMEERMDMDPSQLHYLLISGSETSATYNRNKEEIQLLLKNGAVVPFAKMPSILVDSGSLEKHFVIYPRKAGISE